MDYAKESLKLHEQWKGKIEVGRYRPGLDEGRPQPGLHPRRCAALVWKSRRTSISPMS